jgi:hypothetical protein
MADDKPKFPGSLAARWESFADTILGGCSPIQRREMRRAFYAGASSLWDILMLTMDEGEEPTKADEGRMEQIQDELEQFGEDLKVGRA